MTSDAEPTWLTTARRIVERHQFETVDVTTGEPVAEGERGGVVLDATTASLMVQVHDALNDTNAARMRGMTFPQAHNLTMKLVERSKA